MDLREISDEELDAAIAKKIATQNFTTTPQSQGKTSAMKSGLQILAGNLPQDSPEHLRILNTIVNQSKPMRSLDLLAEAGRFLNQRIQGAAGYAAEKGGVPGAIAATIPATMAEATIPQDRLGVFLAAAGLGAEGQITKAGKAVKQPGAMAKVMGSGVSASTAVPEKYASAIIADPTILDKSTPTVQSVSKMYTEALERIGANIDRARIKKLTDKSYFPDDKEVSKLEKIISRVQESAAKGVEDPADTFLAGRAAAAMQRSNKASLNPDFAKYAAEMQQHFDSRLAELGVPEIRDLGKLYFKAKAKEAFQSWLPQNKNLSPNAMRTNVKIGGGLLGAGMGMWSANPALALSGILAAASASPRVVGNTIGFVGGPAGPLTSQAKRAIPIGLRAALGETNGK